MFTFVCRAEALASTGQLQNMLTESSLGLSAGVHVYYQHANKSDPTSPLEDPTPHIAAFMLMRQEHWYFFGSTGWLDAVRVFVSLSCKPGLLPGPTVSQLGCVCRTGIGLHCMIPSANVALQWTNIHSRLASVSHDAMQTVRQQ